MLQALLQETKFNEDSVHEHCTGGGILPVAMRCDGTVCFLLGREQQYPSWRGACKWSGFEGRRMGCEGVLDVVLREWCEESMNVVHHITRDTLLEMRYVCRLRLNVVSGHRDTVGTFHVMYAVEIPYDPTVLDNFSYTRSALMELKRLNGELQIHRTRGTHVDASTCRAELEQLFTRLRDSVPRCATRAVWDARKRAHAAEYMEKDALRWWTIDELEQVLASGGRWNGYAFRPYFLPVLAAFVDYFRGRGEPTQDAESSG